MVGISTQEVKDGESRAVSAADIMRRPAELLPLPLRNISQMEAICTGFRMSVLSCDEGGVSTHGGCGSRFAVTLNWKGRYATIDAIELLSAWVATWDAKEAEAIRQASVALDTGTRTPARRAQDDETDDE